MMICATGFAGLAAAAVLLAASMPVLTNNQGVARSAAPQGDRK
ncbi:hypothetical protein [Roseovarius spongiae]|nr:hypothetical protein [Roseovarius spongiae]